MRSPSSARARLKVLALALSFVILCAVIRGIATGAASALDAHRMLQLAATGVLTLALTVAATIGAFRLEVVPVRAELRIVGGIGQRAARHATSGLLLGAALFVLVFAITWAAGGISIAWRPVALPALLRAVLVDLTVFAIFAAWEEYTFRGWAFSACVEAFGANAAAIGLSVSFGLAHLANPNPSPMAITSVIFAGALLAYAMLASRNILFPIGIHTGWNFVQALLTAPRYVEVTRSPKAWLSGGEWGLEGSLAAVCVTGLAALIASRAARAR